jgi:hypothetical protein
LLEEKYLNMNSNKRDASVRVEEEMQQQLHLQALQHVGIQNSSSSLLEHIHKRPREDLTGTPDEILLKTSARKDRAMANYYKRLTLNNDIQFYQELLLLENIGEAMKRNIKTKLNHLLTIKVEDRYEDVNIP